MDSCPILEKKPDTKYRYLSGKRVIPLKEAKYIYNHRDKKKFSQWIATQTDEFDSCSIASVCLSVDWPCAISFA